MADRESRGQVYVTLVQAAEHVDGTPEEMRKAINDELVRAVRENPANKRSRWLISLEDAKREFGELRPPQPPEKREEPESTEDAEQPEARQEPKASDVLQASEEGPDERAVGSDGSPQPAPWPSAPAAEDPSAPQPVATGASPALAPMPQPASAPPASGLDVQGLLDRYVEALEKASSAQVEKATMRRRLDDLQASLADCRRELAEAQAQTRQVLVELEMTRAEVDRAKDDLTEERTRPLWKRRKHPMSEQ